MPLEFDTSRNQPSEQKEAVGQRNPFGVAIEGRKIVVDKRLEITFHNTVRVPDNDQISHLPPDDGEIKLVNVNQVADTLPETMALKGGLIMPLYDNEAMWINFHIREDATRIGPARSDSDSEYGKHGSHPQYYAIKIFAGGINVVSGEPENETTATMLRRQNLLGQKRSVQDYLVVPGQRWVDGIATGRGKVRQFVASPLGMGFTVEGQITGVEDVGGLIFEIIGTKKSWTSHKPNISVVLKTASGNTFNFQISTSWTVRTLKDFLQDETDIPVDQQQLIYQGKQMQDYNKVEKYDVQSGSTIVLVLRIRGGACGAMYGDGSEIGIAAGGEIHQTIMEDPIGPEYWDKENMITFNVQILNAKDFNMVTGLPPPRKPLSAREYAREGGLFFEYDEDETDIYGDFSRVGSVCTLSGQFDEPVSIGTKVIRRRSKRPSQYGGVTESQEMSPLEEYLSTHSDEVQDKKNILCQKMRRKTFRTLKDMEATLRRRRFASFE